MIYQFEHEEIKFCAQCPMFECIYEKCNLQHCDVNLRLSLQENDCPLVAISETETTSCDDTKGFDVNWYDISGHKLK